MIPGGPVRRVGIAGARRGQVSQPVKPEQRPDLGRLHRGPQALDRLVDGDRTAVDLAPEEGEEVVVPFRRRFIA